MTQQGFVLGAGDRTEMLIRISRFLERLGKDKRWRVSVEPYAKKRSDSANRYLWGVVYPTILREAHLDGWQAEEVHEWCLGTVYGWETVEGLGRKRVRPIRRSSKLTTTEFKDYVERVQQIFAEKGIYIPDPNEHQ